MNISETELELINRYWQAANYLSVAQIYLRNNILLHRPLNVNDIKPRLLGHWGTVPGLNLVYVHLNRLIKQTGANVLYMAGPGHGAPGVLANLFLEGSYRHFYPEIGPGEEGLIKFCRQFSTPYGIPSHVSAHTPGSIHEGGELGYSLSHAFGAVLDNPSLIAACVVGDGEAETAPLAGSWKGVDFLNPALDGAVLPILHLNGYKIAGPTVLARKSDEELQQFFVGQGYKAYFVEGQDPLVVHRLFSAALQDSYNDITTIQHRARQNNKDVKPAWPVIILRTPKGWTCPRELNGQPLEGSFRSHQVPLKNVRKNPEELQLLQDWMQSYKPREQFDDGGNLEPDLQALLPEPGKRMGMNKEANAGLQLKLNIPDHKKYAMDVQQPGVATDEATRRMGLLVRDVFAANEHDKNFRIFCPDETRSNRLDAVFEVTNRNFSGEIYNTDENVSADGRVMEVLSEHLCQGWLEGYLLTGRHGLFPCYEAFVSIVDSMMNQHAKWLKTCGEIKWRRPIASLNYLLTSHTWRQDHNGYSHQGPGFIDAVANKKSSVVRIYFPPDSNTLLSVARHCLESSNYINLIVAGKQPALQWLDMKTADEHCAKGASTWKWASNDAGAEPDIVLACAGDVPTLETVAASWLIQKLLPQLNVRVVNVVDLMALSPAPYHSHGLKENEFEAIFTSNVDVVFAFHGYARLIHDLVHGRPNPTRFHVRGYIEEGSTTTPFDMVVLNEMSRYHLAIEALKNVKREKEKALEVIAVLEGKLKEHVEYVKEHLQDMPEIENWKWQSPLET
jgi:xylulose-5-phosphate/fructose-6-phosphate phosphoketolase